MPEAAAGGGVELRPMTEAEFAAYRATSEQGYAAQIVDSGQMDAESAATKATEDFARLLPDGLASANMHLWTALVDGCPVGIGWIEMRDRPGGATAWVFDIEVDEARRGEGLGRAIMLALQQAARDLGAGSMGLNVFGHNTPAIRLYESLGYTVTGQQMKVEL
jgi:ribosomal protein S18 acetylase RimI-like enzyme